MTSSSFSDRYRPESGNFQVRFKPYSVDALAIKLIVTKKKKLLQVISKQLVFAVYRLECEKLKTVLLWALRDNF